MCSEESGEYKFPAIPSDSGAHLQPDRQQRLLSRAKLYPYGYGYGSGSFFGVKEKARSIHSWTSHPNITQRDDA
jgi:hypothetical protein